MIKSTIIKLQRIENEEIMIGNNNDKNNNNNSNNDNNHNNNGGNERENSQLYKNIKMLKQNEKRSRKSNSCLLKRKKTFKKPCFIGVQKSHNVNIKNKVQETELIE